MFLEGEVLWVEEMVAAEGPSQGYILILLE